MLEMNRRTVLIVDDDKLWLRSASAFFRAFNYIAHTALTCADGLRLAREHQPDCVLLDFHLPDADADSFCASLRSDPDLKKTPIIIVSGDEEQEFRAHLKCEADGFALKGTSLGKLRLLVDSLLRRVRWERGILEKGDLRLETEKLAVFRDGKPLPRLSLEQFRFLFILMERSPGFVAEEEILKFLFGADTAPEKYEALRGVANRLRSKLGPRLGLRIKSSSSSGWTYVQPAEDKRRLSKKPRTNKD